MAHPIATHDVVDVLAERRSVGSVLARAYAELRGRHVVRPLVSLLQGAKRVREHEAADGIA